MMGMYIQAPVRPSANETTTALTIRISTPMPRNG